MATTTLATLIKELANDLYDENFLDFACTATGTLTTLVAAGTALYDAEASTDLYNGGWLYTYSGVNAGSNRRISGFSPRAGGSYGEITLANAMGSTFDTTSNSIIYTGSLGPTTIARLINKGLRKLRRKRKLPLTLVSDGLMEDTGTTSWTAVNATLAKSTTAANIFEGAQGMTVAATSAPGYATSTNIFVKPGETVRYDVCARVTTTSGTATARLIFRDVTNSANITTEDTTSRLAVRLHGDFTVPSGCYELSVWLQSVESGTTTAWDDVIVWHARTTRIPLPSDLEFPDQVIDVLAQVPRSSSGEPAGEVEYRRISNWRLESDQTGATHQQLDISRTTFALTNAPIVEGFLPYAELSAYTDTTHANKDDLLFRARALAYSQLAREGPRDDRAFYKAQAEEAAKALISLTARLPRPIKPVGRRS